MTHSAIGFLFAGGSKAMRRLSLRELEGRPLIAHTIETARACEHLDQVIVATDDPGVAEVGLGFGADSAVQLPPSMLAGKAPYWLAWQHVTRLMHESGDAFDTLVSLPITSVMRRAENVDQCVAQLWDQSGSTDLVVAARPFVGDAMFQLLRTDNDSTELVQSSDAVGPSADATVQEITRVAFVATTQFVSSASAISDARIDAVAVDRDHTFEIQSWSDLAIAEVLLARRKAMEQLRWKLAG